METRNCQNCKSEFVIDQDDFSFYEKMKVPLPTFCPFCRYIRRINYMNERALYRANCFKCGKSMFAMYHSDSNFKLACPKCFYKDDWDPIEYGRDYDFSENFFTQFSELKKVVPHAALDQNDRNGEGCEYSNICHTSKNMYLSYNVVGSENITYSKLAFRETKNCMDCLVIHKDDRGYELVETHRNFKSTFLVRSEQCVDSHFLYDAINCVDCFMSANIRNKSYVFRNRQLTKEEYQKAIADLNLHTYTGQQKAKEEFDQLSKSAIHKYANIKNSVGVRSADYVENSKDIKYAYGIIDAENVGYGYICVNTTKDSRDTSYTGRIQNCYEMLSGGRLADHVKFSFYCGAGCQNIEYCDLCKDCKDCFGCVALKHKQYCIFNKQYTKEEYEELIPKIKKHMDEMPYIDTAGRVYKYGECFPAELSPFAYNETLAFEEAPLTKEEALSQGYRWRDMDAKSYPATILSKDLPDSIVDVQDSILNEVIACPNNGDPKTRCTSAFKIIPDELAFYRLMKLPIPRYCPNCRYYDRLKWKNPFKFWHRKCMNQNCSNEFETSYAPERPEIVFCESCYQKEVL